MAITAVVFDIGGVLEITPDLGRDTVAPVPWLQPVECELGHRRFRWEAVR
jgi:hypothetical protein